MPGASPSRMWTAPAANLPSLLVQEVIRARAIITFSGIRAPTGQSGRSIHECRQYAIMTRAHEHGVVPAAITALLSADSIEDYNGADGSES